MLDMHHFQSKRIGKLSTGMKQKVSICRTMIHDPEVVIFDEPTSGLDVITAENIIKLIRNCRSEGKTVIFSSHIMSEVDLLCDDLAIIHNGKMLFSGTMQTFKQEMKAENITAEFIRIVNESNLVTGNDACDSSADLPYYTEHIRRCFSFILRRSRNKRSEHRYCWTKRKLRCGSFGNSTR